jgi:hypothetical protein
MSSSRSFTSPTACAFCGQPFPLSKDGGHKDGGHIAAWRASDGRLFCGEFCASSAEEASWLEERRRTRGAAA